MHARSGSGPRTSNGPPAKCSSGCPSPRLVDASSASPRRSSQPCAHLAAFVQDEPGALVFPGAKGGPIRRGNFNKMSAWPHAVASIGMPGLHFHDLRHTGNQFAAQSGAGLQDLMARIGHDSERAAMIYQHVARGADQLITSTTDAHVQGKQGKDDGDENGSAGILVPAG
jgi:integrase